MITEIEVAKNSKEYEDFLPLYLSAFPQEERISVDDLFIKSEGRELIACYEEDEFVGFYATLTVKDITHIIYFAVPDELRNRGIGSKILSLISNRYADKRIILDFEAEDETSENNEQRKRRKAFYLKNGYKESEVEYIWRGVPYNILINKGNITDKEFWGFWDVIEKIRNKKDCRW
jgi:ribosomal protein S18 acetylase RimI-like enzyme